MLTTKPSESSPRQLAHEIAEVRAERERITRRLRDATTDEERVEAVEGLRLSVTYLDRLEEALHASSLRWEKRVPPTPLSGSCHEANGRRGGLAV